MAGWPGEPGRPGSPAGHPRQSWYDNEFQRSRAVVRHPGCGPGRPAAADRQRAARRADRRAVRSPRWPRFLTAGLHRNISLLVLAFLVLHIGTTVLDSYTSIRLSAAFVPFISGYKRIWLGLGAIALDLLMVLLVTSLPGSGWATGRGGWCTGAGTRAGRPRSLTGRARAPTPAPRGEPGSRPAGCHGVHRDRLAAPAALAGTPGPAPEPDDRRRRGPPRGADAERVPLVSARLARSRLTRPGRSPSRRTARHGSGSPACWPASATTGPPACAITSSTMARSRSAGTAAGSAPSG